MPEIFPATTPRYRKPSYNKQEICTSAKYKEQPFFMTFAIFLFMIGTFLALSGYRGFKASQFLTGLTWGIGVVYAICTQEHFFPEYGNIMISLVAGILFGLITMLIQYVGLFMTGLLNGILIGTYAMLLYGTSPVAHLTSGWVSFFVLLFTGVVFACLNLYWKKGLTILATSLYGATIIAMTLDFFIYNGVTVKWGLDRVKLKPAVCLPCTYSGIPLAIIPLCTIIGIIVQWNYTGTGIYHEESLVAQKRRLKLPTHLTREQRAEMRQRKYRYLYQVRTAHGDVISQSYVQALQQKTSNTDPWNASGAGECSTLQSDSTHLTALGTDIPQPDSDEDVNQIRVCH